MRTFDLAVLGAGAAGLVAAREAARLGARVALIHDGPLGGECTWTGCVPSKALLHAAAGMHATFDAAMTAVHDAISRVAATEDAATLAAEGITVLSGHGVFRSPTVLDVGGTDVGARRTVVATGGTAAVPPIHGLGGVGYLTNDTIFELSDPPRHLAIIGGGAIGCELAQAFGRLGVRVTIVESETALLAREEPEAADVIAAALKTDGVEVRTGVSISAVASISGGIRLTFASGDSASGDGASGDGASGDGSSRAGAGSMDVSHLLVAAGRRPCSAGFGLAEVGVTIDDRGYVQTDDHMATSVPTVFAAGDVTGKMPFTHAAARMAYVAANNALSRRPGPMTKRFDTGSVPWVTFTTPEVGRVGWTESAAAGHGSARVAYLPLDEVDRGLITGDTAGFVKLVAGPRPLLRNLAGGRLLGATAVAPTGGEMIHEAALAMQTKMFVGRLAQTVHAYPTWSTAVQQAALQFFFETGGRRARRARR